MEKRETRKYFGKTFWKQKDGYWVNNMPIHAQRWVWINYHAAIPQGMDIHHKDGDKSNNEIDNLEMLNRSDHLKRHWANGTFDVEQRRKQLGEARKWLKTPEGRIRQKKDALESWEKRKPIKKICAHCANEFCAFYERAKFCSDPCTYQFRRKNSANPIQNPRKKTEKICIKCEKKFMAAMPYALYCSTRCRKGKK